MNQKDDEQSIDLKTLLKKMFSAFLIGGLFGIIWFLTEIYISYEAGVILGWSFIIILIGFLILNFTQIFKKSIQYMDKKKEDQQNFSPVGFFFIFFIAFEFIRKLLSLIEILRFVVIFIYPLAGVIIILVITRKCSPMNKIQLFWLWFLFILTNLWYVYIALNLVGYF